MPLRVIDILIKSEEDEKQLMDALLEMIRKEKPCGIYQADDLKIYAFDLLDHSLNEVVLRCVYTLVKNDEGSYSIVDVDLVIPNENITDLEFVEIVEDNEPANEVWDVGCDARRSYAETVNRHLIRKDIKGIQKVSLSAMTYGDLTFGKNSDEINEEIGFKPTKFAWQEEMNMGLDPLPLGYADDFVGMGIMMAEIVSHKKISFKISSLKYTAIVAWLKTGFGKLPALFSTDHEKDIIDGNYVLINADLKADLSCGELNYYESLKQ